MSSTTELLNEGLNQPEWLTRPLEAMPAYVAKVEAFCRQSFTRPIGVRDLAKVANMSRCHFSREFHKVLGISPGRFICHVRMEHAMRLVKTGGFTVKDMAQQCGFSSANYFCKVFRKTYGMSPGSFETSGIVLRVPPPVQVVDNRSTGAIWPEFRPDHHASLGEQQTTTPPR